MAARKTSSLPTQIWKFPCRVTDEAAVHEILRTANRYYNALVAIERARHARYQEIRRRYAPELAALEEEWERIDDQIEALICEQKRARQQHWRETDGEKRRLLDAQIEAQIAALRTEAKRVSAAAKERRVTFDALLEPARQAYADRALARAWTLGGAYATDKEGLAVIDAWRCAVEEAKTMKSDPPPPLPRPAPRHKSVANAEVYDVMLSEPQWPDAWKEIARSDDEAHKATLAARASCGLATGTYLAIEEAVQRAKMDSSPRPPRFRLFDDHGKLAVQTRDLTFAEALAGSSKLSIAPAQHRPDKRGDQSRMVVVRLDQTIPRKDRRVVELKAKLHRRPPDDAVIKWASLLVRRVGSRTTYEFQLTLEHPSFAEPKRPAGTRDAEHVRIGWARVDGGVRVAHWPSGDVVLPDAILDQHEHAAAIESAADRYFERVKKMLRRWMRGGPHHLTAWHLMQSDQRRAMLRRVCREYAEHMGVAHDRWKQWKTDRLSRGEDLFAPVCVVRRWLRARGVVDQQKVVAFWLYTWARKDEHLMQLAADSRRRFQNRRDTFFRREAIRIATEFSSVTVDDYNIAKLKELPSLTMPGDTPRDQSQHNAHAAAPGRFREILLEVMGSRCTPCERPSDGEKAGAARAKKRGRSARSTVGDAGEPVLSADRSQHVAQVPEIG